MDIYGPSGPVLLMGAVQSSTRRRTAPAATCRDFECEIREIGGYFCAVAENRFKIAETSRLKCISCWCRNSPASFALPGKGELGERAATAFLVPALVDV
jgi:hypothetical protein